MAFQEIRNFNHWHKAPKLSEEEKRPDSPTIMVTKTKPPSQSLTKSTIWLIQVYQNCNPSFYYNQAENPTRPLTKPSEPKYNDSFDNENYRYILYVNDKLISPEGEKYTVLDSLGEGTFGQVVKCKNSKGNLCAAKVIKNKPAYYIQGLIEVKILSKLNKELDPNDSSHIVRMLDYFVFRNHLVIIFELLSLNIYELLRENRMRGFSLTFIRSFTKQLMESLVLMEKGNIIHCDLKPENVLLVNDRGDIKVIDLGSACFENATIYTYIQSRYYRSPEVLIGLPYGSEIDMWSLGCICAEIFIGIPLFPGSSDYDQLFRIVQLLGMPPRHMIDEAKLKDKFFLLDQGDYRLKTREEFMETQNVTLPPFRAYLDITCIDDLLYLNRKILRDESDVEGKRSFIGFLKGLLQIDPMERWSASQAISHPFVQGKSFEDFKPSQKVKKSPSAPSGALRGSCPSFLQRIRGSQDQTVPASDVCFRPLVEDLRDDFFTGFVHGKLVQVQKPPPQPSQNSQWNNPFMNLPISLKPNNPLMARPLPDIIGPRYTRPHSYGEEFSQPPRPFSPMIEQNKPKFNNNYKKKKNYKGNEKKSRSNSSKYNEYVPKVIEIRPSSLDDKKTIPDRIIGFNSTIIPNSITQQGFSAKAVDPSGFLDKVKKEASSQAK